MSNKDATYSINVRRNAVSTQLLSTIIVTIMMTSKSSATTNKVTILNLRKAVKSAPF